MRNYTNRQVGNKAVQELTDFLNSALDIENFIKNIVDECESLLSYNGTNNNRISKDIIKGVIKQEYYLPLPVSTGGKGDKKRMLQFEVRHWDHNPEGVIAEVDEGENTYMTSSANTVGYLFFGSGGFMAKQVNRWQVFHGPKREPGDSGDGIGNHFWDFVKAIRAGDQSLARGDIREGFYSCALIHLANISYRLGRSLDFDPVAMKFVSDPEADAMLTKAYRAPYVLSGNL